MDFLLVTVFYFGIFTGFNAHPSGSFNYVCREGEEYNMCRSPCEPTCDTLRRRFNQTNCSRSCVSGCFCRDGLVRARDNTCVLPENCRRAQCPENEEYQECGSPCALNCTNLHEGIFCSKPCHRGCFCKPNFVRNAKGKCVDPRTCGVVGNRQCPVNEQYVNCVNNCNTCSENPYCSTPYCTPGCDCKYGYLRNSYGECIHEDQCPPYDVPEQQCGVNEIYTTCVGMCNDCISRGRCDYEYYCTPGCDCKQGYFRNERDVCVPERNCFIPCNDDEIYLQCGPSCRSTCENYRRLLYHSCKDDCVPGCFCRGSQVIGPGGRCIAPEFCPSGIPMSCPRGEIFYHCMPTCRTTCLSLLNFSGACTMECRPGCFCQPGFVRNIVGRCVRSTDCPRQSPSPSPGIQERRGGGGEDNSTAPITTPASTQSTQRQPGTEKPNTTTPTSANSTMTTEPAEANATSLAETTAKAETTTKAETSTAAETTTTSKAVSTAKAETSSKAETTTKAETTSKVETTTKGQMAETAGSSPASTEKAALTSPSSSEKPSDKPSETTVKSSEKAVTTVSESAASVNSTA